MTAVVHAYVSCDHADQTPAGPQRCPGRIDGETKAGARRIARQRGWLTGVHHDGTKPVRGFGPAIFDFCPDHKPAPKGE